MTEQISQAEQQEIDGLKRVLERFVIYAQMQLKENFQKHPEATFNQKLVSETVVDMSVAAAAYEQLCGENVYQNAEMRERGTLSMVRPMFERSAAAKPEVRASAAPTEDDLKGLLKVAPEAPSEEMEPEVLPPMPAKGRELASSEISRLMKHNAQLINDA